jgi:hypothetical protein
MHIPPCEAVDLTFVGVDNASELVPTSEAKGVHDGALLGAGSDIGDPVDVTDGRGGEVLLGRVGGEDDLGDPRALIDQRQEDELDGEDGVDEDEHGLAHKERDGETPSRLNYQSFTDKDY